VTVIVPNEHRGRSGYFEEVGGIEVLVAKSTSMPKM
jgi:hypothetical protein